MEASPRKPNPEGPRPASRRWRAPATHPVVGTGPGTERSGGTRIPIPEPWAETHYVPHLGDEEVHIFRSPLIYGALERRRLRGVLSDSERRRAVEEGGPGTAYTGEVGRALLRILLGDYLGCPPDRVPLVVSPSGRPHLSPADGEGDLRFDIARSGDVGIFAFTRSGPLGVTLEELEHLEDLPQQAKALSPVERDTLLHLPPGLQNEAFHQCRARKNALVRAVDSEPAAAPCDFDVSVTPGVPPRVYRWVRGNPRDWSLLHLRPGRTRVGAVAVLGEVGETHTFSWSPSVDGPGARRVSGSGGERSLR